MNTRARLVAWRVVPVVMADDGEELTPINVQPVDVPAAQWQAFKDSGDAEFLASIQQQLDNPPT